MTEPSSPAPKVRKPRRADRTSAAGLEDRPGVLYAAAAIGAFFLAFGDIFRNKTASTTTKIAEVLTSLVPGLLGYGGLLALLFIVISSCLLCWLYQPRTRIDAFARGFSVFAILTVAAPYELKPALSGEQPSVSPGSSGASLGLGDLFAQPAFALQLSQRPEPEPLALTILLQGTSGGPVTSSLVTLRDPETSRILAQEKLTTNSVRISQPAGKYLVEIDASGYRRASVPIELQPRSQGYFLLMLEPSAVPLGLQRLYPPESSNLLPPLRSSAAELSEKDIRRVIEEKGFSHPERRITGTFQNSFERKRFLDAEVVLDRATGLMWQHSGSPSKLNWNEAQRFVRGLNANRHGGFADWRLPTVEELLSLLESERRAAGRYIDTEFFDNRQEDAWSADRKRYSNRFWEVEFDEGGADADSLGSSRSYVRAVRSARRDG